MQKVLIIAQSYTKANFFMNIEDGLKKKDPSIDVRYIAIFPKIKRFLKSYGREATLLSDLIRKSESYKSINNENVNFEQFCQFELKRSNTKNKKELKKIVNQYLVSYRYFIDELFEPNVILIFNGEEMHNRTLKYVASEKGIENLFFFENGFFPETLVVDRRGVNFSNSLVGFDFNNVEIDYKKYFNYKSKIIKSQLNVKPNKILNHQSYKLKSNFKEYIHKTNEFLKRYLHLNHPSYYYEISDINLMGNILTRIKSTKLKKKIKLNYSKELNDYEDFKCKYPRFILVPLQVPHDTQVLVNSSWIQSIEKLIEVCLKSIPDKYGIVFKVHPATIGKFDIDSYKNQINDNVKDRIKLLYSINTYSLIKDSCGVITINSTVGLESLLYNKHVITLGDAFWAVKPAVGQAKDINELKKLISENFEKENNTILVDKILSHVMFNYLYNINFSNPGLNETVSLVNSILFRGEQVDK